MKSSRWTGLNKVRITYTDAEPFQSCMLCLCTTIQDLHAVNIEFNYAAWKGAHMEPNSKEKLVFEIWRFQWSLSLVSLYKRTQIALWHVVEYKCCTKLHKSNCLKATTEVFFRGRWVISKCFKKKVQYFQVGILKGRKTWHFQGLCGSLITQSQTAWLTAWR